MVNIIKINAYKFVEKTKFILLKLTCFILWDKMYSKVRRFKNIIYIVKYQVNFLNKIILYKNFFFTFLTLTPFLGN